MSTKIDFKVYNVVKRKGKDDFWNTLGGAFSFETEDGRKGITIPALNLLLLEPKQDEPSESDESPEVGA